MNVHWWATWLPIIGGCVQIAGGSFALYAGIRVIRRSRYLTKSGDNLIKSSGELLHSYKQLVGRLQAHDHPDQPPPTIH